MKPIYDGRKLETMRGVDVSEIKHYVKGNYRNIHNQYVRPSSLNLFPTIGMTNNNEVYTTSNHDADKMYAEGLKNMDQNDLYDNHFSNKKYFDKEYANAMVKTKPMLLIRSGKAKKG